MSGGRQPAYALVAHGGGGSSTTTTAGSSCRPTSPTDRGRRRGGGRGRRRRRSPCDVQRRREEGKCFVCICEDVTDKDVKRAIAEGFDSIELAKRYTTVTMGPWGKLCHVPSIRLYARENETDEATIGTTTARPPWQPVELGLLAGRPHEPRSGVDPPPAQGAPARRWWTGTWRRPTPTATRPPRPRTSTTRSASSTSPRSASCS